MPSSHWELGFTCELGGGGEDINIQSIAHCGKNSKNFIVARSVGSGKICDLRARLGTEYKKPCTQK